MPHEIRLRTTHPDVHRVVGDWLRESRITTHIPLELRVEIGALAPEVPDSRPIFTQGRVVSRAGPADAPVTLSWGPGLGHAVILPGSTSAAVRVTPEGFAQTNELLRSFLLNISIFLLRRAGLHHVHGATLSDPSGRDWMLVGESGSGKSTTTVLLGRHGWRVGTDDIAFLANGGAGMTDMVAWRERLALRDDANARIAQAGGTVLDCRSKTGWYAEELGTEWIGRVSPRVIGFTKLGNGAPTSVTPVSAREALTRVMHCSPWVMLEAALADEHLALMSQLVHQARAYEITLGHDLFDNPDLLLEHVA